MQYPKKSLGQNFLTDLNIISKIINSAKIYNQNILEIGPGKGALTDQILEKNPKSLTLIEKDISLFNILKLKYANIKNIKIFNKDILKFDFEKKLENQTIIFGNLPYNISSQILVKIIKFKKWPPNYNKLILMFQKEMADRISGEHGSSKYGRLSILTKYRLNILKKFNVSPNCFFPKPKVVSTVICFEPKKIVYNNIKNIENLEKITNIFFSNKRKMINKSMNKIFKSKKILDLIKNIDLTCRPSELQPEKYFEITKMFEDL